MDGWTGGAPCLWTFFCIERTEKFRFFLIAIVILLIAYFLFVVVVYDLFYFYYGFFDLRLPLWQPLILCTFLCNVIKMSRKFASSEKILLELDSDKVVRTES